MPIGKIMATGTGLDLCGMTVISVKDKNTLVCPEDLGLDKYLGPSGLTKLRKSPGVNNPPKQIKQIPGENIPFKENHGKQIIGNGKLISGKQVPGKQISVEQIREEQNPGVQIRGEQIPGVQIRGEQIPGEQIRGKQIHGVQIRGEQIPGVQFRGEQIPGVQFRREQIPGVQILGEQIPGVQIREEQIPGEQMRGEQNPGEQIRGEQIPGEQIRGEQIPGVQICRDQIPGEPIPEKQTSGKKIHGQQIPSQQIPGEKRSGEIIPDEHIPEKNFPGGKNAAQQTPEKQMPLEKSASRGLPLKPIQLRNIITGNISLDRLHSKALQHVGCGSVACLGSIMSPTPQRPHGQPRGKEELSLHAKDFIQQYYESIKRPNSADHVTRLQEVLDAIETRGTYDLTFEELTFGAKTAWRNASRCIGRIQWSRLKVIDGREARTARQMFELICEHIRYSTNGGNIRSAVTIFPPRTDGKHDFRVWNSQIIHYAGYKQPDGSVIGDPANVEFTEVCKKMGWRGAGGMFDVLPVVLSANGEDPQLFEIPEELVLQTHLKHPTYPWFAELGLKWYCVPMVSNMLFDCGGLEFTGCPFNGWYMGTEIGARDLCDAQRYNILEKVAVKLGVDIQTSSSLWKDRVLLEVNVAVLHSFQQAKVTIIDHHSAAESFMTHLQNEQRLRGGCPADWVWVVPPMSGSLLPVFHQEMLNYHMKPSYEYQDKPWTSHVWKDVCGKKKTSAERHYRVTFLKVASTVVLLNRVVRKAWSRRVKCTILYATETGKSERFSRKLEDIFRTVFDAKVICMEDYNVRGLTSESLVLIVTSTFGNGEPPDNGQSFFNTLSNMDGPVITDKSRINGLARETSAKGDNHVKLNLCNLKYSVFGLGSRAYTTFCAFAHNMDKSLAKFGANRITATGEGDELCGQERSFQAWAKDTFVAACREFSLNNNNRLITNDILDLCHTEQTLTPMNFRLTHAKNQTEPSLSDGLTCLHKKNVRLCRLINRCQLQSLTSSRQTIRVVLEKMQASGLDFRPGDHLGIFPANPKHLVDDLLAKLDGVPAVSNVVQIEATESKSGKSKNWTPLGKFPPFSLRRAFTHYLDITSAPTQLMLRTLASLATNAAEANQLMGLGTCDPETYNWWVSKMSPNIVTMFELFPSLRLTPAFLISQLPVLQHRFYSISSSPDATPGEIHATLAVVKWKTQGDTGPVRHGVCSNWLNTCQLGEKIPCIVRKAVNFHLPEDNTLPIIMVGPGTGIAPFRSFWQQRAADMKKKTKSKNGKPESWGKMTLYTGCRQVNVDDIYTAEITKARKDGVIAKQYRALSRERGIAKTYVQDILVQNAKDVYRTVVKKRGHIYVCGDVVMASDVSSALETILQIRAPMSSEMAKKYVKQLKETSRYHEDIFGTRFRPASVPSTTGENNNNNNNRK